MDQLLEITNCEIGDVFDLPFDVIVPSINVWANVNNPKNMKFVGDVRRTLSQHAIEINVTNRMANATQNNSL